MRMLSTAGPERRRLNPALNMGDLRRRLAARRADREPLVSDSESCYGASGAALGGGREG